jgi:hypothetical protein
MYKKHFQIRIDEEVGAEIDRIVKGAGISFGTFFQGSVLLAAHCTYEESRAFLELVDEGHIDKKDKKKLDDLKALVNKFDVQMRLYKKLNDLYLKGREEAEEREDS